MAEALALIGLASSIVQFVAFGAKVVERLQDFQQRAGDVPKAFQAITIELPVLLQALKRTETQIKAFAGRPEESILKKIVQDCHSQVKLLDEILVKTLPEPSDNSLRRGRKAFHSLRQEGKVKQITKTLGKHVQLLTYYHTSGLSHTGSVTSVIKAQFMVPFLKDEFFINRENILQEIDQKISTHRRISLAGIGGVGKSQIAIEYCYRYRSANPGHNVFWVPAGTTAKFERAYGDIARKLCLPGWDSPQINTLRLVTDWLSTRDHGHWLLVIDNADDKEVFFGSRSSFSNKSKQQNPSGQTKHLLEHIPMSPKGCLLVTTRDKRIGELLCDRRPSINVQHLEFQTAEAMLRSRIPAEKWNMDHAHQLLSELDYLPLAITQAAAFISDNYITIKAYLDLLHDSNSRAAELLSEDLGDPRRDLDVPNSVVQTWKISFDQIRVQEPRAADALSLIAMLDRQGIPKELLSGDGESAVDLASALGTLQAFSLLRAERGGTNFEMHRLVQLSTRTWLKSQGDTEKWQREALVRLSNALPSDTSYKNWSTYEEYIPHAQAVLQYGIPFTSTLETRASLLDQIGRYFHRRGNYQMARDHVKEALDIRTEKLGRIHQDTLSSATRFALILAKQGEYDSAERLQQQTLEYSEQTFGPEHEVTLENMRHLGLVLYRIRKYQAAEKPYRKALYVMTNQLGSRHPRTLSVQRNLAMVLAWQGKLDVAAQMNQDILKVQEENLGSHHPDTIASKNDRATTFRKQEKCEAAEHMLQDVLNFSEGQMGLQYPDMSQSWHNLGSIFERQKKLEEAMHMYQKALRFREQSLGPYHPDTLRSKTKLGKLFLKQGKLEAAEPLLQQALEDAKKELGPQHRDTLSCLYGLGLAFIAQRRNTEAESLLQQALEGMEKPGMQHKCTLNCVYWLAMLRYHAKDYDQAIGLMQRAHDSFEKMLGRTGERTKR